MSAADPLKLGVALNEMFDELDASHYSWQDVEKVFVTEDEDGTVHTYKVYVKRGPAVVTP